MTYSYKDLGYGRASDAAFQSAKSNAAAGVDDYGFQAVKKEVAHLARIQRSLSETCERAISLAVFAEGIGNSLLGSVPETDKAPGGNGVTMNSGIVGELELTNNRIGEALTRLDAALKRIGTVA